MNPWDAYAPGDPRADPKNWDPFGLYIGPTEYEPDYHGGTISTEYQPGPTIFQPGSVYTGSGNVAPTPPAEPSTVAPATSPDADTAQVSPDVRSAPTPVAPATAPATAPPLTTTQQGPAEAPLLAVDQGGDPAAGGTTGARYDYGASHAGASWGAPATSPHGGNRWNDPIFARYFATLGASQPDRVALIRGLPDSVSSVQPQVLGRRRPQTGYPTPATAPRTMPGRTSRKPAL